MTKPAPGSPLMEWLKQVDWPRQLQRAGVLVRRMRGDTSDAIAADHELEMQRGEGLHRVINRSMRAAVGCVAPKPCSCTYCSGETT